MAATRILVNPGVVLTPEHWIPRWGRVVDSIVRHAPLGATTVVLTSAFRPNDPGRHGHPGGAEDWDVLELVPEEHGSIWAARVQQDVGWNWDVIWHKTTHGNWHIHAEDESVKARTAWTGGQRARLALLA